MRIFRSVPGDQDCVCKSIADWRAAITGAPTRIGIAFTMNNTSRLTINLPFIAQDERSFINPAMPASQ
jgi:hypothetical protein